MIRMTRPARAALLAATLALAACRPDLTGLQGWLEAGHGVDRPARAELGAESGAELGS